MLEQFQAVYPEGRLISELVTIYHGKFIVRTLIQMNGEILASGLAAGDTVEMAEDLARVRSLENLGFTNMQGNQTIHSAIQPVNHVSDRVSDHLPDHQIHPQINLIGSPVTVAPVNIVAPANIEGGRNLVNKSESLDSNSAPSLTNSVRELVKSKLPLSAKATEVDLFEITKPDELVNNQPVNNDPPANIDDQTILSRAIAPTPNIDLPTAEIKEQELTAITTGTELEGASVNKPLTPPSMQVNADNHEFGEDAWLYTDYSTKSAETSQKITDHHITDHHTNETLPGKSHQEIPTDLSDVHVKLDILLDRLAWDKEREREFLEQTYHERSRSMLPDEKLLDFADYLEVLCQVVEELKRQGWKPSQERDYLEYNWQGRSREELTKPELENMYAYLQVFQQTTSDIKRLGWTPEYGKKYLLEKYAQQGRARLTYDQLLDFQEYLATQ